MELAEAGFGNEGGGNVYPYVLVTLGGAEPEDGETYKAAFTANSYTEEAGQGAMRRPLPRTYVA